MKTPLALALAGLASLSAANLAHAQIVKLDGSSTVYPISEAVAEEFQCVLIITHVEELKEVFPARIEVSKGINGSQAVVIRS